LAESVKDVLEIFFSGTGVQSAILRSRRETMPEEMLEIGEESEVAEATEALKKTVSKIAEDAGRLPGRYARETLVPEGGE
jgi:hypothetical protein